MHIVHIACELSELYFSLTGIASGMTAQSMPASGGHLWSSTGDLDSGSEGGHSAATSHFAVGKIKEVNLLPRQ